MTMPTDVGVVDLMMAVPTGDRRAWRGLLEPLLRDRESREFEFPAEYMFKDVPGEARDTEGVRLVLEQMDRHGVSMAMIGVDFAGTHGRDALEHHRDRFIGSYEVDPNRGNEGVRDLRRAHDELGVKAATTFPAGCNPQVPIDDPRFFPLYAACVDLDIPIFVCAGVPGPRVPAAPQEVARLDAVCACFPELRVVTRHGCEPWTHHAVELLWKWPNLHYSTSAFAPRHYPRAVVDFANGGGADKVLYAGYFPMGLSLERIMAELPHVPFADHVWPRFLRDNALRVLRLDG